MLLPRTTLSSRGTTRRFYCFSAVKMTCRSRERHCRSENDNVVPGNDALFLLFFTISNSSGSIGGSTSLNQHHHGGSGGEAGAEELEHRVQVGRVPVLRRPVPPCEVPATTHDAMQAATTDATSALGHRYGQGRKKAAWGRAGLVRR